MAHLYKAGRFLLLGLLAIPGAKAQNINSPYSVYGIGEPDHNYYDRSSGMANTSMGLLTMPGFSYIRNPASLVGLERSNLQVDLALTGKTVSYSGNPITETTKSSRDLSIKRFAVGIKLNKAWASSFGGMPYTYVNYQYTGNKKIEGTGDSYFGTYEGDGGLYNIYWNNAFAITKHLALAVRSSFLFGSINKTETLQSASLSNAVTSATKDYYNNFRFEYGLLYKTSLGKNWKLGLGGKYAGKTGLRSEQTLNVTEGTSSIVKDEVLSNARFYVPKSYDAGISLTHHDRTTFAVDYAFEDWNELNNKGNNWALVNSHRVSAGVQFSNTVEQWNQRFEKSFFQFGVYSNQSYLLVNNTQVNEFGVTAGYGGFLKGNFTYALSVEGGRRGTTSNGLIRENYVKATLALSYREFLFSKGRKYN